MHEILRQKITDAVSAPLPTLTRREARIPSVPGKALAVIGVRRSGKTPFLWQCLGDRLAAGRPREALPLLGLEDDRLSGMGVAELDWLLEEYFRQFSGLRDSGTVTLFLDEIQNVPGWEVDFLATAPGQKPWLVQVCLESGAADTWERGEKAP